MFYPLPHCGGGDIQPGIGACWEAFSQVGCMSWVTEFAPSIQDMVTAVLIGPQVSTVQQHWENVSTDLPKLWVFSWPYY